MWDELKPEKILYAIIVILFVVFLLSHWPED